MSQENAIDRLSKKWLIPFAILSAIYWLWFAGYVGVSNLEIAFYILMCFLAFYNRTTRRLLICFSPMLIYLLGYSSLRVLHQDGTSYIYNEGLYDLELSLFGFSYGGQQMIPCEYFAEHHSTILDLFTGIFYISWMPFPIIFALIAFFSGREKLVFHFWLAFLMANLLAFIGYIFFPAAPPWYYLEFGSEILHNIKNSAAGFARFDALVGIPVYESMYKNGTNTFGAMPSMHAAFPLVLTYYARKFGKRELTILFAVSLVSIWFGAIYSNHHYILDVIVGIVCGIIGILLSEILVNCTFAPNWYKRTVLYIQSNLKK